MKRQNRRKIVADSKSIWSSAPDALIRDTAMFHVNPSHETSCLFQGVANSVVIRSSSTRKRSKGVDLSYLEKKVIESLESVELKSA